MFEHLNNYNILQFLLSLKIIAIHLIALIMFALKLWSRKFMMNQSETSTVSEDKEQHTSTTTRSAINLAYEADDSDLRLIARPQKGFDVTNAAAALVVEDDKFSKINGNNKKIIEDTEPTCESKIDCQCRNCRALLNLTECGVCLESLQSNQIKSCPVCANVICKNCDARLANCAFCRSTLPAERNRALERLVDRLILPCKNAVLGCKILLDGESRFIHESICNYSSIACPVGRICGWHGTVANVQSHLHSTHNLQPLHDHGITVEIQSFPNKARAMDGRVYTVCLACYEQLFIIRIILFHGRLRLCFIRLGYEDVQPIKSRPERYGISAIIRAHAGRRLRALVPFGKYDRESREITITCENLYPKGQPIMTREVSYNQQNNVATEQCTGLHRTCFNSLVKIELMVRKLSES